MRTSVRTDPDDVDESDEWPECRVIIDEDGGLDIVGEDDRIETTYAAGEWVSVEVVA